MARPHPDHRHRRLLGPGCALVLALTACAPAPPEPQAPRPSRPTFTVDGLATAPLCDEGAVPATGLPPVRVRLVSGPGVSARDTQAAGEALRVVWERLGLTVQTTGPDALDHAPDHLFAPSPQTEAEGLAPLQAVLGGLSVGEDIAVVVMPRFVTAPSRLSALRGLTVPVRGKPIENGLQETLLDDINPHSHPVVLLNLDAGPRAPGDLSLTPAHELGHALGLPHRSYRAALMSAGDLSLRCLPSISAAERTVLHTR